MQPPIEQLDVSMEELEELEALVEQTRPALSEDGYGKLSAAIASVAERGNHVGSAAADVVSCQHREDLQSVETGGHPQQ